MCCHAAATQPWRCSTRLLGSTPSCPCYQPACWTSAVPPPHSSLGCWHLACHRCWSFPLKRSVKIILKTIRALKRQSCLCNGLLAVYSLHACCCFHCAAAHCNSHSLDLYITLITQLSSLTVSNCQFFFLLSSQVLIVDLCANKFVIQVCTHNV